MLRHFLPIALCLCTLSSCGPRPETPTETPSPVATDGESPDAPEYDDFTFVPGERFGQVSTGGILPDVEAVFGDDFVPTQLETFSGATYDGYHLFEGTPREVDVTFMPARRLSFTFRDPASPWSAYDGRLRIGTPLEELERLNGRPFTFYGFDWDYAGNVIDWNGGELEDIGARLRVTDEASLGAGLRGEVKLQSDDPAARAAGITVREITVLR